MKSTAPKRQQRGKPISAGLLRQLAAGVVRHVSGSGVRASSQHGCLTIVSDARPAARLGRCSNPAAIGTAAEGAEAAETTTWDRASQAAGENGLTLTIMTRVAYYDAGDETLYGYTRTLTFDSRGMLATVGAETRVSIDVAEAC